MLSNKEKLGAFIVPTGVGASIGGFAGDASNWARKFSRAAKLIVNPNVVNAGGFSGLNDDMLYVEGYSLDRFFKGEICLQVIEQNKIGVVFDCAIPQDVLNIHINTINAMKTVYGVDVIGYELTEKPVGVEFSVDECGISIGSVQDIEQLLIASKKLLKKGANAIALLCLFEDPEEDNPDYAKGLGIDPVGGVEAILSHYISKELQIPCAHSPAFADYQINSELVDAKSASEYITPTFLPCVLSGLDKAPQFGKGGIAINNLVFLVMPYNSLGSVPVLECAKRGIDIFTIRENSTMLGVTAEKLGIKVKEFATYQDCLDYVNNY